MPINKNWHLKNKMPEKPTPKQRLKWHLEHAKNCDCPAYRQAGVPLPKTSSQNSNKKSKKIVLSSLKGDFLVE
jgi:hypothetical protein